MKGCALKKTLFAVERARADIARHRKRWTARQAKLDPERLVFIDETWIRTTMAPLRGWGPKGERVRGFAQIKHWMRNAQKREIDDIWRHLGRLIDTIEPQQCANYFKNAGYASIKI